MGSLSGVTSVLSPLLSFTGIPGAIIGAGTQMVAQNQARRDLQSQQDLALRQLHDKQNLDANAAEQSAVLQKAQITADAATSEARRLAALRRSVARQKTLFSAHGLGSADTGSNEAVLLGLYNDSERDADAQATMDNLRNTALDQSLTLQKQKNLLESTQLRERQSLARILQGY